TAGDPGGSRPGAGGAAARRTPCLERGAARRRDHAVGGGCGRCGCRAFRTGAAAYQGAGERATGAGGFAVSEWFCAGVDRRRTTGFGEQAMSRKSEKNLLVGLDIGTSKVVAIVGELTPRGVIEVVGIGSHPSRGMKKGAVVNIESTVQSIQRAVEEAELMAGCQINSVLTGIAGSHIRSLNSHGIVAISDREVTPADV